jgi:hypothetical protein
VAGTDELPDAEIAEHGGLSGDEGTAAGPHADEAFPLVGLHSPPDRLGIQPGLRGDRGIGRQLRSRRVGARPDALQEVAGQLLERELGSVVIRLRSDGKR